MQNSSYIEMLISIVSQFTCFKAFMIRLDRTCFIRNWSMNTVVCDGVLKINLHLDSSDIGVKSYPMHHNHIIEGLNSMDLSIIKSRGEATTILSNYVKEIKPSLIIIHGDRFDILSLIPCKK